MITGSDAKNQDMAVPTGNRVMYRIGDFLRIKGVVTEETIEKALEIQRKESERLGARGTRRRRLGDIMIDDLGVDRHQVYQALAELYGFREIEVGPAWLDSDRLEGIESLLEQLQEDFRSQVVNRRLLPTLELGNLVILAADPTDSFASILASRLGYRKYEVAYFRFEDIDKLIGRVAPHRNEFLEIIEEASESAEFIDDELGIDEDALDAEINQSLLGSLIEGCLVEAVRRGVSDIHVIPREGNRTEFHFREDGKLYLFHAQDGTKPEAILAVVKDRTINIDRFERERGQDGFIQRKIDDHLIRFRVSVLPIVGKEFERKLESIVIRILDDRKVIADLDRLGLQGLTRERFIESITKPQGIVILTGPTGSGKSTTLVAALNQVMDSSVNVLTVEDPVEYIIPLARQIKINYEKLTFEHAVRAILRHDPDIVMVGEMRDLDTAQIAIKLANTGHLTFSTLHTNDAPSAVSRLYKMGVEPFLIANAINIVVAQRLVPTLCPLCKKRIEKLDWTLARSLGFTDEELSTHEFYEAVGCDECRQGYKGRTGIHEALLFTKTIRRLILEAGEMVNEEAIREQAVAEGMITLRASGRVRILEGITTLEAVAAVTTE